MSSPGSDSLPAGMTVSSLPAPAHAEILTPAALRFVARLVRHAADPRAALLRRRRERQAEFDAGALPDFLSATRALRESDWRVAPIPADLQDRRVEITGPVERKMIINALNSGAQVFMADFEDSLSPTWRNCLDGQLNLRDAVRRTIDFSNPDGKLYRLNEQPAVLMVRPRGWHLPEKHVRLDGAPVPGALFDFGLYLFHNARELLERGTGPYFYLPKLEGHLEARLWNEIFELAQDELKIPRGTIRATVLIETILASFETHEILYELRNHSAGLNCGRWDYIFSFIKKFCRRPEFVLPDRAEVTMTVPFMRAYCLNVIKTCHQRGAHAIGGMSAFIPIKGDPAASEKALATVRADKEREADDGHDGTWVAHPGLVSLARECFDARMPTPNQIARRRDDVRVAARDLLAVPTGTITEEGVRTNIRVGVQYLEAWLGGNGCVPLYNLMEDAATAEISRTQLWQWIRHPTGVLADGRKLTGALFRSTMSDEMSVLRDQLGAARFAAGRFGPAQKLFDRLATEDPLAEFLTLPAYEHLNGNA
ncbi:MAG: malate synthase A [Phycisphaerae bacterium]